MPPAEAIQVTAVEKFPVPANTGAHCDVVLV